MLPLGHCFGAFLFDVSLRRAPKNYPKEGNFLEAKCDNVEFTVVQISWLQNRKHSQAN